MKLTRRQITHSQLRKIIKEELAHVVFDDIHIVPDDLGFLDPYESYGLGHKAGMEHSEEDQRDLDVDDPSVEDAWHPSDVVPKEDAWSGGDNLEDPLDYARFETGESNWGPHNIISEASTLWSSELDDSIAAGEDEKISQNQGSEYMLRQDYPTLYSILSGMKRTGMKKEYVKGIMNSCIEDIFKDEMELSDNGYGDEGSVHTGLGPDIDAD